MPIIPITASSKSRRRIRDFSAKYKGQEDEYGFNLEAIAKWEGFFRFFYEEYFQVETLGLENIPADGRAVLVGNHSGGLPIDAFMLYTAVLHHHPCPRRIRFLSLDCLRSTNVVKDIICGFGGVPNTYQVATKLLQNNGLVFFYPEGARGTGKPFSMRYRLHDFDPGFVKAAIFTGAPIVPVTTIGCDEIYPLLGNFKSVARLLGTPYWPMTPTFPWLPSPISCLPLPIKILIKIGKPIYLNYPQEMATDRKLRLRIAREIQYDIQRDLNWLLRQRKSPFAAWDTESTVLGK